MVRLNPRAAERRSIRIEVDWRDLLTEVAPITLTPRELCEAHDRELVQVDSSSLVDFRCYHRRFLRDFGDVPLRQHDVRTWRAWLKARRLDPRPLAPKTLSTLLSQASVLYSFAIRHGAMDTNPIRDLPAEERPGRRHLDPFKTARSVLRLKDIRSILTTIEDVHAGDYFEGLLFAGALMLGGRSGELAGLRQCDYDPRVEPLGRVTLRRQWHAKTATFRDTKDKLPKMVPVHPVLAGLLSKSRAVFYHRAGRLPMQDEPLFPFFPKDRTGASRTEVRHWNQRTALIRWQRFQEAHLPPSPDGWRNFHSLRHTFITRLHAAGAKDHAVRMLTHPSTVLSTGDAHLNYVHVDWDGECEAISMLDFTKEVLGPKQHVLKLSDGEPDAS